MEGFYRNSFYLSQLLNTDSSRQLLFLQEIWTSYSAEDSMCEKFNKYSVQISTPDQFTHPEDKLGSPDHTWHGTAIMWHESLNSSVLSVANVHHRFTGIRLDLQGFTTLAISLYLPTSGKDEDFLACLVELSIYIRENTSNSDAVLIGTDSNCSERSSPRRLQAFTSFVWITHCKKYVVKVQLFTTIMVCQRLILITS